VPEKEARFARREGRMLRIWGRTNSSNVQKVLWCCVELGLAYERIEAGAEHGVVGTPEYRAMNPNSLVPTIDDDGFVLWESNVIVRYLAQKHGLGTLCPRDIHARFLAEKWMDWQTTTLWPAFMPAFIGLVRTPAEKRDGSAIAAAQRETARRLGALEAQLGRTPYVAGSTFTMGDIPAGISAFRLFSLGIERSEFPNVAGWYDGLTKRPGYKAHGMLPLT
jgi:glutathione S-transferase